MKLLYQGVDGVIDCSESCARSAALRAVQRCALRSDDATLSVKNAASLPSMGIRMQHAKLI